jgi:homocysteine S-methyltransferase
MTGNPRQAFNSPFDGKIVLLDGATGTELERRGVPMDGKAWSATAVLTHPQLVREVHRDYIEAGADVIIANTFSLARHMLVPAGLEDQFQRMNNEAMSLALSARDQYAVRDVAVAGSISPTALGPRDRGGRPHTREFASWFNQQAEILAESGADLLIIEMISDSEIGSLAVEAAVATGLPVWLGFSCREGEDGRLLLWSRRDSLADGVRAISRLGGSAALIMHTDITVAGDAFRQLKEAWDPSAGPLGVYAHSGHFVMPNWQFTDITPDEYADQAQDWISLGANIIGGCCGIGPLHILELKRRFADPGYER